MPRLVNEPESVRQVLAAFDRGNEPDAMVLRTAVLHLLHALVEAAPGRSVEVRVPPYGAVQCGLGAVGPQHRRGTPPNVVELDAGTWIRLATARLSWDEAVASGQVSRSGTRADLAAILAKPLFVE